MRDTDPFSILTQHLDGLGERMRSPTPADGLVPGAVSPQASPVFFREVRARAIARRVVTWTCVLAVVGVILGALVIAAGWRPWDEPAPGAEEPAAAGSTRVVGVARSIGIGEASGETAPDEQPDPSPTLAALRQMNARGDERAGPEPALPASKALEPAERITPKTRVEDLVDP